ncbi:competence protein ComJ [Pseudomonas mucidolens]|uniref:Competence protein J (ComJ) n=1 Tax=Pseudomonas mucidolens TaxID=46679 RepID=A0A1H2NS50_9PSED|nr:competence protein ComJ [Pseudomonas mucidolens]SDV07951.1 Competence protein J (ComJ) [Pseudomonas mucidolens]SQH31246.1 Competence protein J (ComJ) [Pseudomonas mucidolens]
MAKIEESVYLSYSQFCVFMSSLDQPYNDWSDRSYTQGFSWRVGSVSFRAIVDQGDHKVNIFLNEEEPALGTEVVRAFRVPFIIKDKNIEVGSISDAIPLEIPEGEYILRVEFVSPSSDGLYEINVRFNKGVCDFEVLRADAEINDQDEFDINAAPAT